MLYKSVREIGLDSGSTALCLVHPLPPLPPFYLRTMLIPLIPSRIILRLLLCPTPLPVIPKRRETKQSPADHQSLATAHKHVGCGKRFITENGFEMWLLERFFFLLVDHHARLLTGGLQVAN